METERALKVRIYPNKTQEQKIINTLGCARFIWNQMLAERISVYNKFKDNIRQVYEYGYTTEKQFKNQYEWLKDVDSIALQQTRRDLSQAYQNFFRRLKSTGKPGFPKFKKRGCKDAYRTQYVGNNIRIDFENKKAKLPILGWGKFRDSRKIENIKISNATISRTKTGKYFVSFLCKKTYEPKIVDTAKPNLKTKGLDMSLTNFFVDENGNSPAYEKLYRKYEPQIAYWSTVVSRRIKGSKNRAKAQLRLNRIHEKVTNCRKDFVEKLSRQLINENDVIVVENLNMKNMAQTLRLGKSVNDLGWGNFLNRLKTKAEETGKIIIEADKWFASSKTCSKCGFVKKDLQLNER